MPRRKGLRPRYAARNGHRSRRSSRRRNSDEGRIAQTHYTSNVVADERVASAHASRMLCRCPSRDRLLGTDRATAL